MYVRKFAMNVSYVNYDEKKWDKRKNRQQIERERDNREEKRARERGRGSV